MTGPARGPQRSCRLVPVLALAAAVAPAQDGLAGTVRTIDGRVLTGALVVREGRVTLGTADGEVVLDLAELTSFEREGAAASVVPAPHRVWLRSGGELPAVRIAGQPAASGQPAVVTVETPGGVVIDLPLGTVRALRQVDAARPEPALFAADLKEPPASSDLLYVVKDGKAQRSSVTVTSLSADRIDFQLRGSAYDFELSGVAAVVFGANTGFAPDRQPKPRTRLLLTSGERFEGRLLAVDAARARCRLDEGAVVDVPAGRLLGLQVASDRLAWLTEMTPQVEQTPAFDRVWPWTIDRTPAGPGLVLAGKPFARGLCLVPRTRLTWDLGGRFDRFEATIGIDDRGGPEAHAVFRVLVDGQLAFESAPRTRGQAPEVLSLELKKARSLALEVDFGKNYDLGDYCVFADARVVQQ